ncbi:hypothetical protein KUDE01_028489 [Dissostichus eleginoides]|uniref:Adrenomedullin n=1 Tax=Dissostichus eleginoides TaxID=100907 RepID=A0AAD9BRK9_DISEL|nr:hypothetical protein KUDE01_028489 [Dissostichus eleginoides]
MRLALHTVICCCVFTTVLPLVKCATGEINTSLKKRSKVWLHTRMKRDLCNTLLTAAESHSDIHVGAQQDENGKLASLPSSFGLHIRPRRTPNKAAGCALVTCALHDLLYNLHRMSNTAREVNAPENKMGSGGYGRRRRSLLDVSRLALQTGRQRRSIEAGQRVHRHKSTRTVS